jgi:large subunit ribosomal protein L14e
MGSLETGRVVMKICGKEAGKYAVVLKKLDDAFVMITGPKLLTGVKRRKCNVEHLEPLQYTLEIKEDAPDEEVIAAFEKAGLVTKFGLKRPSAAEIKAERDKPEREKEKPKEKPKKEEKEKRKIKFKMGREKEKKEVKEEKK